MERTEWLARLVVGNEVAIKSGYGYSVRRIATVVRLTATQIIVTTDCGREARYRKRDGKKVGGDWSQRLEELTQTIRDELRKSTIVNHLEATKWASLDLVTLEQVASILRVRTPTEAPPST